MVTIVRICIGLVIYNNMMQSLRFSDYIARIDLVESARRSFSRILSKFGTNDKPAAIITAFTRKDPAGVPMTLSDNRSANEKLQQAIAAAKLSSVPVIGAGQENNQETGVIEIANEESFLVQPIGSMDETEFVTIIKRLLFNPVGEAGIPRHKQYGAAIKLPSSSESFLLVGSDVKSPNDYKKEFDMGTTARPRRGDDFFTQLRGGARLKSGDPALNTNEKGGVSGRRFSIKNDT